MFRTSSLKPLLILLPLALLAAACSTGRTTTTTRTAVEQALLSQAAEDSINALYLPTADARSYVIKKDYFNAVDGEFILGALNKRMLEKGMAQAEDEKSSASANLIVYPVVANAGIDDTSVLIGLPEIPLTMPSVGAVTIPELAFFKFGSQIARNRLFVYAKDGKTKRLVFKTDTVSSQKFYNRWTVLFVFTFRTTDLKAPH